jgi:hypothetical protein
MAGIDFPKMENRKPKIYISLHLIVKLVATDDKRRNVTGDLSRNYADKFNPKMNICFLRKLTKQKRENWNLKSRNLKTLHLKLKAEKLKCEKRCA